MAFMTADDGTRLFHRLEGPDGAPPIILSNSLGSDHMMWQSQAEALAHAFRVIRYDQRGHGASDGTGRSLYSRAARPRRAGARRSSGRSNGSRSAAYRWAGSPANGWAFMPAPRLEHLVLAATATHLPPREALGSAHCHDRPRRGLPASSMPPSSASSARTFRRTAPATVAAFRRTLLATSPEGYAGVLPRPARCGFQPAISRASRCRPW
jgi:pimeloyl-ACP methyl ester carboxylesterase